MLHARLIAALGATATVLLSARALPAQVVQGDTVALPELVVTAERTPTPLAKSIATTTVLKGDDLRAQGLFFVEDALRQVPGAMPVPSGSFGGIASLFLRGGESDYTKVLIDGVAVNQPGGAYNFGTLSIDNVDRIEIVRGPVSVLYGSDAVSGVIQIFTRRGTAGLNASAGSQAGSFGTWTGTLAASGGQGPVSFSGSLSRYRTDGIYEFNSGYRSTIGGGAVTWRPDRRSEVTLTARRDDNTLHFPTDFTGAVVDSNQFSTQQATTLGLDLGRRVGTALELRAHLDSRREVYGSSNQPDSPGDTLDFYSRDVGRSLRRTAGVTANVTLDPRVKLVTGLEGVWEALLEEGSSGAFDQTRHNYGIYGQALLEPAARSVVNLGVRLDDNEKFGSHLTARVGTAYALTRTLRARASVGTSFKEPSLRENYAQGLFERGNPGLDPEQATSWEVGLEQSILAGNGSIAANYFDQRFRDLIQYDGNAAPDQPTYQNVAKATARGVEIIARVRPVAAMTLGASYTYLVTRVDDAGFATGADDIFVEGEPLVRRPKHSARFDARGAVGRVSLGAGLNVVGRRDDVDFRVFPQVRTTLGAYVTVDADAAVDIVRRAPGRPGIAATFRAENLFDRDYETVVGFAGRGRLLTAGARVGW